MGESEFYSYTEQIWREETGKISEMQMGIGRERVYLLSLSKKQQFSPFPREEALPTFSPVSPTLLGIEEKKAEFVE